MNQESSVNRLRHTLMVGVASVSFLAIGCGGSDNTVVPPTISNQGSSGVSSLLFSNNQPASLSILATDGTQVSTGTLSDGGISFADASALDRNAYYAVTATSAVTDTVSVPVLAKGSDLASGTGHLQFTDESILASHYIQQDAGFVGSLSSGGFTTPPSLDTKLTDIRTAASTAGTLLETTAKAVNSLAASYYVTDDARQPAFSKLLTDYLNNPTAKFSYARTQSNTDAVDFSDFSASVGRVNGNIRAAKAFNGSVASDVARAYGVVKTHLDYLDVYEPVESAIRTKVQPAVRASRRVLQQPVIPGGDVILDESFVSAAQFALKGLNEGLPSSGDFLDEVIGQADTNGRIQSTTSVQNVVVSSLPTFLNDSLGSDNANDLVKETGKQVANLVRTNTNLVTDTNVQQVMNTAKNAGQSVADSFVGGSLEDAGESGDLSAENLDIIKNVGNVGDDNTGLGNLINRVNLQASRRTNNDRRRAKQLSNTVAAVAKRLVADTTGVNIGTELNTILDDASNTLGGAEAQTIFEAANRSVPFAVKIDGDAARTLKLAQGESITLEFLNNSSDVDATNAAYTWTYSVSGTGFSTTAVEMTENRLKMTVAKAATASGSGSVSVNLRGTADGEEAQTANASVSLVADPKFLDILGAEGITVVTGSTLPVSVYAKYPGAAGDQTLSVQIGNATAATTTVAQADAIAGVNRQLNAAVPSTAGATNVVVTFAGTTESASITVEAAKLSGSILNVTGTTFSSGTSAAVNVASLVRDTFASPSQLTATLNVYAGTNCSGTVVGTATATYSGASVHNFSLSTNVAAGVHCAMLSASTANGSTSATQLFSVVEAAAPQISGVNIDGVGLSSESRTVFTTVNGTHPYSVNVSLSSTGDTVVATLNGTETALTVNSANNGATGSLNLTDGANELAIRVTNSDTSKSTVLLYGVDVVNVDRLSISSFEIDGSTLNASESGGQITLTTGNAQAYNNTLAFKMNTSGQTAGNGASVVFDSISVRLTDIGTSTPRSAKATLSGITLTRNGTGDWSIMNSGGLEASATKSDGSNASMTRNSTAVAGNLGSWFSTGTNDVTINMGAIRDYLVNNITGDVSSLATLSGDTVRVVVELKVASGSSVRFGSSGDVTSVRINGITVQ